MKYLVILALLPFILTAEGQSDVCVDGTQCPQGKYCCESGCCGVSTGLKDKVRVSALPHSVSLALSPASTLNITITMTEHKSYDNFCLGTQCGLWCHTGEFDVTCCSNPQFACRSKAKCCSNSDSEEPWCCKQEHGCSPLKDYCTSNIDTCSGTLCGPYCHEDAKDATCCSNPQFACISGAKCCSNSDSEEPWCCKKEQDCSPLKDHCIIKVDTCSGTICGSFCHDDAKDATCCSDPMFACPSAAKCCSNSDSKEPWCCKKNQICSSENNMCINSAMTTSAATMSLLLAFIIGIVSKNFL